MLTCRLKNPTPTFHHTIVAQTHNRSVKQTASSNFKSVKRFPFSPRQYTYYGDCSIFHQNIHVIPLNCFIKHYITAFSLINNYKSILGCWKSFSKTQHVVNIHKKDEKTDTILPKILLTVFPWINGKSVMRIFGRTVLSALSAISRAHK